MAGKESDLTLSHGCDGKPPDLLAWLAVGRPAHPQARRVKRKLACRVYYREHAPKLRQAARARYRADQDRQRRQARERAQRNRAAVLAGKRAHYQAHREAIKADMRRRYEANKAAKIRAVALRQAAIRLCRLVLDALEPRAPVVWRRVDPGGRARLVAWAGRITAIPHGFRRPVDLLGPPVGD